MLQNTHYEGPTTSISQELDAMKTLIKTEMENAFTMTVPLDVEVGLGQNWLEAH